MQFEAAFLEATETFYHEEGNAMINQVTSPSLQVTSPSREGDRLRASPERERGREGGRETLNPEP